jgi:hypothetical protein
MSIEWNQQRHGGGAGAWPLPRPPWRHKPLGRQEIGIDEAREEHAGKECNGERAPAPVASRSKPRWRREGFSQEIGGWGCPWLDSLLQTHGQPRLTTYVVRQASVMTSNTEGE